jgi:hypothetical protein
MSNSKYTPTVFDKFLYSKVNMKPWMLFMLVGIPLMIVATSILASSAQSALSFSPMSNGAKTSGIIMTMGDDITKDYPDFKPDSRVAELHYKEATVQYAYDSQFYNLKLDAPIPDVGKKVGDTIPLLVNPETPSKAVADVYLVPYNMPLIIFMCVLNAVGLSLIVNSLIQRKRPSKKSFKR